MNFGCGIFWADPAWHWQPHNVIVVMSSFSCYLLLIRYFFNAHLGNYRAVFVTHKVLCAALKTDSLFSLAFQEITPQFTLHNYKTTSKMSRP